MQIFIERTQENLEKQFSGTAGELLASLGFTSQDVLIICNNKLVTEDEFLENNDSIKLLSVISGG